MSDFQKPLNIPIITGRPEAARTQQTRKPATTVQGNTFGDLLQQTIAKTRTQEVTLSKHAQARTEQRGIDLTQADLQRLSEAVGAAGAKGVTDTLVFMNNTAFIVNVPSGVVVTVVDGSENEQQVFTNIDGAVIL